MNKWRSPYKKMAVIGLIVVICTFSFTWDIITSEWRWDVKDQLCCFEYSGNKLPELSENEPKLGFDIFFHETSCPKDFYNIKLNARQSCSVESALRMHPNNDVYLLITTPVLKPLHEIKNIFIKQLNSYPNFKVRHITFSKYLSNTPLYKIYQSGVLNSSQWPVQHSSDILRYATLYKLGGIYLDLDVMVLKPLTKLGNFVGAESNTSLGSGILGFSFDKTGREVATQCAKELARTYNPRIWGFNGPGVITRVMEKRCKTTNISLMTKSSCEGFQVYPEEYFQAISFNEAQIFFQEGNTEKVQKLLNESYTIHYWNKMSSNYVLDKRLDIPYISYAKKYCPKTYEIAKDNFS